MKKLEIKYISINEIKPYKNNPRINELKEEDFVIW